MHLDAIELENFRCFDKLRVTFDRKLTVLVAPNGSGKTTILSAIRIALWPFVNSFDQANSAYNDPANSIAIDDVLMAVINEDGETSRFLPARVRAEGELLGVAEWVRYRERTTPRSQTLEDANTKSLRNEARDLQAHISRPELPRMDLPVFGYYGTERLWSQKKLTERKKTKTEVVNTLIRTYGYRDCLDPASSYKAFEDWYVKAHISHISELLKIGQREKRVAHFDRTAFSDRIQVVKNAINVVLDVPEIEWRDITYDAGIEELVLTSKESSLSLKVNQLSDGIRNMIGMVADIAYRCYQLNAHLGVNAAVEATGVILIDEVDMHLHPKWQQLILKKLQDAFPKIQFIVTTHSPQVLTTVKRENIRVISKTRDGVLIAEPPMAMTYGEPSNSVLRGVMFVDPMPPIPEKSDLQQLTELVDQGNYDSEVSLDLMQRLKADLGEQNPQLQRLQRSIQRQKVLKR